MASEIAKKPPKKSKKKVVPPIQITLTTFSEEENGELSPVTTENVKIDGEETLVDVLSPGASFDWSILRSAYIRNLLVLSLGQFLLFTAFDSLSNLQDAFSDDGDALSLFVVYGTGAASSLLVPPAAARWLGCKRALVVAGAGFLPYVLAHIRPAWSEVLLPTAVVCGLASGLMLTARNTYLNRIGRSFSTQHRTSTHVTNAWFFSVCLTVQQNSEIWGNLLSHCVLLTVTEVRPLQTSCGPDFCGDGVGPRWLLSMDRRYVLVTIYSALALVAVFFTAFFLDPLEEETEEVDSGGTWKSRIVWLGDFLSPFRQFSKPDQVLMVPLSVYTGMFLGFYKGDYAKAYIACAWGMSNVSTVSLCFGVVSVLVGCAGAPCVVTLGRSGLFLLAALAHLAMFLALFLWRPHPLRTTGFFLVASAGGIGNGVWMAQITALYGVMFPESEVAAFSCFYFLHASGFLLARTLDAHPCTYPKLFAAPAVLAIGIVCYLAVEVRTAKRALASDKCKEAAMMDLET